MDDSEYARLFEKAVSLHKQRQITDAKRLFEQLLVVRPQDHNARYRLGILLHGLGHFDKALECIEKALDQASDRLEYRYARGAFLQGLGRVAEAIDEYDRVISTNPRIPEVHAFLGSAHEQTGAHAKAIAAFERALALRPEYPEVYNELGNVYTATGDAARARACYERALELKPGYADPNNNLGTLLHNQRDFKAAILHYRKAIESCPTYTKARFNLAIALRDSGDLEQAKTECRQILAREPSNVEAHVQLSFCLLQEKNFEEGWKEHEWRLKVPGITTRKLEKPLWKGEDISKKTVYVYHEQGLGDTIQFLRYIPLLATRCQRILLRVQNELNPLMRGQELPAEIVPPERSDEELDYDVHIPLMSMPMMFKEMPVSARYIVPDQHKVSGYRQRFSHTGVKVGVFWCGNPSFKRNKYRAITLAALAPLFDLPRISWYSLQKGQGSEELHQAQSSLVDLGSTFADFSDTAAALENLDLLITTDTAIAHMSGALGRPTWLLLDIAPDWRWGTSGEESYWYPSVRLFRQTRPLDWTDVISRVRSALRELTSGSG
ncbi:tetratricopeptide repeat protein [Candidatus Woesearchaeota archaeon]|nr:tetratricopeptide repeat protein [Candidatus Woesearchaeota archaeon]